MKISESTLRFCQQYRLPILSGILIGTSYIPSYPIAVFWSFVPLWTYLLKNLHTRSAFFAAWITQFILTLIGFHWVAHTAHEFGLLPWPIAVIVLLGFAATASLHIPIAAWIWAKICKRWSPTPLLSTLCLASLIILGEFFFPMIFPWHHGYVWLWANWPAIQFADVIGVQSFSAICLFSNVFFYFLWQKRKNLKLFIGGISSFIILFLAFNYLGAVYGEKWQETDTQKNFLVVQANIGNIAKHVAEKGDRKATREIAEKFFKLTEGALKEQTEKTNFIVWPETAYPEYLNAPFRTQFYNYKLKRKVKQWQVPLITGGYRHEPSERRTYNSIFFVDPQKGILPNMYSKTHLLAFGEYFPGAQYFPFLKKLVPTISDFGRGHGPVSMPFFDVNFGPQICYEGLYPEFSSAQARNGAEIFINVTNDSWFGQHYQPYQHLYMTLSRAIESRRPVIRSTNTGISTAILASGEVLAKSPIHEEWTHVFPIKYKKNSSISFFSKYGDYGRYFFLGVWLIILLSIICGKRKSELN